MEHIMTAEMKYRTTLNKNPQTHEIIIKTRFLYKDLKDYAHVFYGMTEFRSFAIIQ